ncbi:HAD family hydrolase [Nitrosomonas sp. ANs5]|uniref:HAD family hydrolase n=1 Tax=Nitrosomonas sp. ANs5 TaxID=3423941 RepID=UPI003D338124
MTKQPPTWNKHFNADALWRSIHEADAVSFDFFDTLFVRPLCDPEDVFDIVGARFGLAKFRVLRKAAQAEAFRRMHASGRREISLSDIYDCFDRVGVPASKLMQAEYAVELDILKPNDELTSIFCEAITSGKFVLVISDMYLPKKFFLECLQRHGLPEVPVFVSSECNATKRDTGELFDFVVKAVGKNPDRFLHIGDNPVSDEAQAKRKGMRAFLYRETRKPVTAVGVSSPAASIARALIRTYGSKVTPDSYKDLGFRYGGPAAVGFLDWIVERAQLDNVDHVLFMSRDGYILNRLAKLVDGASLPEHHYFYGSRTAFNMAAMTDKNFANFIPFLVSGADGLAPYEILERIGVTPPSARMMAELGVGDKVRFSLKTRHTIVRFLWAYRWEILKVCRRNRKILFRQLIELGISDGCRVALVDIGWNGTTQEAFERAIKGLIDLDIIGYYFSLSDKPECVSRQQSYRMISMMASCQLAPDLISRIYRDRVLVECFFSAPHHSIIGWMETEASIVPIEDPGRADVSDLVSSVSAIMEGAELFAKSYWQLRKKIDLRHAPVEVILPLLELVEKGGWRSMSLFSNIKNFDAWGSSRNHDIRIVDY